MTVSRQTYRMTLRGSTLRLRIMADAPWTCETGGGSGRCIGLTDGWPGRGRMAGGLPGMLLASRHACRARVCRWRMRHRTVGGPGSCGQHMRPPGVPRPPGPGWCRPRCSQRGGMRCVAGDAPDTPGTAPRSLARCAVSQQAGGCRQHTRRPARARHGGAPLLWHRRRALRLAAQLRAAGAIGQRSGTPEHATPGPAAPIRTPGAPAARSRPSPAECCRPATRRPSRRAKGARRGPRM